jgi:ferredoxin
MTYVVTENCIKCKYMDCVEVCPVDCFYEGENMVVVNPTERIDCGVCEPECPADAIKPDSDDGWETWLELNTQFSVQWPNVTGKRKPAADATDYDGMAGKLAAHLLAEPRIRRLTGLRDRTVGIEVSSCGQTTTETRTVFFPRHLNDRGSPNRLAGSVPVAEASS